MPGGMRRALVLLTCLLAMVGWIVLTVVALASSNIASDIDPWTWFVVGTLGLAWLSAMALVGSLVRERELLRQELRVQRNRRRTQALVDSITR